MEAGGRVTPMASASAALVIEVYIEVSFVFKSKTFKDVPVLTLILSLEDSKRKLFNLAKTD